MMKCATRTVFANKDFDGAIRDGADELKKGGLVVFPTETVYGLGANALSPEAVKNIFFAKGRPQDNPLIVHIAEQGQLDGLVTEVNDMACALMDAFWPGPLSIVMKKTDVIPPEVSAGLETVAVRMPDNDIARGIIALAGVPVAAPSANTSGKPSPTLAMHAYEDLCGRVPLIIDGGPCRVGVESTVVDMTGEVPLVLRPGDITPEMIAQVAGDVRVHPSIMGEVEAGEVCASPGMKYKHYSPEAKVTVLTGDKKEVAKTVNTMYHNGRTQGKKTAVLCLDDCAELYPDIKYIVFLGKDAHGAEAALFRVLREMDDQNFEAVLFHAQEEKMGLAVMNRIIRAAGHEIISVKEEKV
ncbi:MAG: L-threonylcarbamoyladenylate synthase [Christensenella sp.]|uniref:L-threonylcarbamoyladenylate synthase n=1 Tax=Christensenella sp. TaxID=1935934 RepID=UPI002B1F2F53|nr:L-threonylcarbamoyladenylate synthase [Christensenella sp.]MEA5004740.1 L-threonylcarbamoyladenylate synthase [Christensenella sp.]